MYVHKTDFESNDMSSWLTAMDDQGATLTMWNVSEGVGCILQDISAVDADPAGTGNSDVYGIKYTGFIKLGTQSDWASATGRTVY